MKAKLNLLSCKAEETHIRNHKLRKLLFVYLSLKHGDF